MRLATRTALAAALAAVVVLAVLGLLFRGRVRATLLEGVDQQLEARAATAPILAAVGERLAVSELGATVEGARVATAGGLLEVGALPDDPLPALTGVGWATARADGQDWRLYTVAVAGVPDEGDRTLVQLVAPLGDIDAIARRQRRTMAVLGLLAVAASGAVGYAFGSVATRPLARLRRDAGGLGRIAAGPATAPPAIREQYGAVEVDEIAGALRAGLDEVAEQVARREAALGTARGFAASAAHELRTPLTAAVTNLDVAARTVSSDPAHTAAIADARAQLDRITSALAALRALTDAELADPSWFDRIDLVDLVSAVVEAERRRAPGALIDVAADGDPVVPAWADGLRLAVGNLVRNALLHGRRGDGTCQVVVTVSAGPTADPSGPGQVRVTVDDDGPGIPAADRERVLRRFERGAGSAGTGLGLTIAAEVAHRHGGGVTLGESPAGGTRATLTIDC